jgi:hypothetical protein
MSAQFFDRRLEAWLEEGPSVAPADLLPLVLDALPRAAQRRRPLALAGMLRAALLAAAVATVLVIGAVALTSLSERQSPPGTGGIFAGTDGWITYRSGTEVISVNPTNPDLRKTFNSGWYADPVSWSADGTELLLVSPGRFIVLHADGSVTQVSAHLDAVTVTWGSLSPSGDAIAFAVDGDLSGPYVVELGGGEPKSLLTCRPLFGGSPGTACGEPLKEVAAWAPDGSRIAWIDFMEDGGIYGGHAHVLSFVNPDGTGVREAVGPLVPEEEGQSQSLAWAPDGSRLVFWVAAQDTGSGQIWVVKADGSGLTKLTAAGDDRWPTWSPDGTRLAFVHDGLLSTMAADGTDVRPVGNIRPDGAIVWNQD